MLNLHVPRFQYAFATFLRSSFCCCHCHLSKNNLKFEMEERVKVLCCKHCNAVLLNSSLLSDHRQSTHTFSYNRLKKDSDKSAQGCTSYFLETPTRWMQEKLDLSQGDGKILCKKCMKRVGSFCWSGSQCSCGSWVVPAIQFTKSKFDARTMKHEKIPKDISLV